MAERVDPFERMRRFYEDAEERTAAAMEEMVQRDSFGEVVARVTENVMALTRIGFDVSDLVVRGLRIAGRHDVVRLGHQIARTEDKLEMVLQALERLEDELSARDGDAPPRGGRSAARSSSEDGSDGGSGAEGDAGEAEGEESSGGRQRSGSSSPSSGESGGGSTS